MNRVDFMRQLESLLQSISPAERAEALQYYNDYFDDAGPDKEQEVIEALGSPAKVAETIRRDMAGNGYGEGVYQRTPGNGREIIKYQGTAVRGDNSNENTKNKMPAWAIALIVVLCVLASPVLLVLAGAALGVLVGILGVLIVVLAVWLSLIVAFGAVSVSMVVVFVVLIGVGFRCLLVSPWTGLALIGAGLVCLGVGVLFIMLTVALAGIVTPAIFKGIAFLCKKIFRKKGVAA